MLREPLIDGHGRRIADVRVSVTDRCNFRCQYCMPAEGLPWLNRDALLSYEEIERLVRLLSAMGVHDVRLTGGEPLVRRELWRLVEKLSALEDVHDLSLTTNGYLLERQVGDLVRAGLRRVNVSLDALAPDRFFQLTRRDSLKQVLEGLAAAQQHPELMLGVDGVHRGHDRAELPDAELRNHPLGACGQHERDAVASPYAKGREGDGRGVAQLVQSAP